jgi:putative transposase
MFQDADDKLPKKVSRTVWRTIHRVLKYKAPLYGSFIKEVSPHSLPSPAPGVDWFPERSAGLLGVGGAGSLLIGN